MTLQVSVDHDRCVGSTMCVQIAPAVFEIDTTGQSVARPPGGTPDAAILDAAENCPMEAIRVVDGTTGRELFPG